MNIEQVREFALGINPQVTEELFAENWISWRIFGKWFLLMQLDAPEPRVAVTDFFPINGRTLQVAATYGAPISFRYRGSLCVTASCSHRRFRSS